MHAMLMLKKNLCIMYTLNMISGRNIALNCFDFIPYWNVFVTIKKTVWCNVIVAKEMYITYIERFHAYSLYDSCQYNGTYNTMLMYIKVEQVHCTVHYKHCTVH